MKSPSGSPDFFGVPTSTGSAIQSVSVHPGAENPASFPEIKIPAQSWPEGFPMPSQATFVQFTAELAWVRHGVSFRSPACPDQADIISRHFTDYHPTGDVDTLDGGLL